MKYFSMFSGIGGFEYGIKKASGDGEIYRTMECIGFSEIDKYAIQIYKKHFPTHKNYGNARNIDTKELPDFDMLCGGFPCQSFSIAGKRKGFQDTRGTLFHEICRIVESKRPKLLFLENVKGLLSADNGRCFATILTSLDELGYNVEWQVLNSKNFGVPQNRERVFIIGHLRGESKGKIFPLKTNDTNINQESGRKPQLQTSISGTITTRFGDRYQDTFIKTIKSGYYKQGKDNPFIKVITHSLHPRSSETNKGGTGPLSKEDGTAYCVDTGNMQGIEVKAVLTPNRLEKRQNGRRFKENGEPSFTLTGRDIHRVMKENKMRRLTPIECERLQGFPDNWTEGISDTQRYKCLGNAVTTNVIEAIAERLI